MVPFGLQLPEQVEHVRQQRGIYALSVVAHFHRRPPIVRGDDQPKPAARIRGLGRVVQQVCEDLRQPGEIGIRPNS